MTGTSVWAWNILLWIDLVVVNLYAYETLLC